MPGEDPSNEAHSWRANAGDLQALVASRNPSVSNADERECDALIVRGKSASHYGHYNEAEESLCRAALLAERMSDSARLARAALSLPTWHWPSPGAPNAVALLLAERALQIERNDVQMRAMLLARLAAEHSYSTGQQSRSIELVAAAMELTRDDGAGGETELAVRVYRDALLRHPEDVPERLANAERILQLAIKAGDYDAYFLGALARSDALTIGGNTEAAEGEIRNAVEGVAQLRRLPFHESLLLAHEASRAVMDGKLADAVGAFERCRALASQHSLNHLVDGSWPAMLLPFAEESRLSELEAVAEGTLQRLPHIPAFSALLCWLKLQMDCSTDAFFHFDRLAGDDFNKLSRSNAGVVGLAALAAACQGLGRTHCAAALYERLLPHAGLNVALNAFTMLGSAETYLGELALVLGRADVAIGHFESSLQKHLREAARPWLVYSEYGLARSLAKRGRPADRDRARTLLASAEAEAETLKMRRAFSKIQEFREQLNAGKAEQAADGRAGGAASIGSGGAIDKSGDERASAVSGSSEQLAEAATEKKWLFSKRGEYWTIAYEGWQIQLRHRTGLTLLAHLLAHPGTEFHALELARLLDKVLGDVKAGPGPEAGSAHYTVLDPAIDAAARRSYRERLVELRQDLAEAETANDVGRAEKVREEMVFLTRELASALGIHGRERKRGSASERARVRVTNAIRLAIAHIRKEHQALGEHLSISVRTGTYCSYLQPTGRGPLWRC